MTDATTLPATTTGTAPAKIDRRRRMEPQAREACRLMTWGTDVLSLPDLAGFVGENRPSRRFKVFKTGAINHSATLP